MAKDQNHSKDKERPRRLSDALRQNLRRRKQQVRGRKNAVKLQSASPPESSRSGPEKA